MNHFDDRNKGMDIHRQDPVNMRADIGGSETPVILSALTGFTIGFFIAAGAVVLIRVMANETDGMRALMQALAVFIPAFILTVIARTLHKRSKQGAGVSKMLAVFCGIIGLSTGSALWVTSPTEHGLAMKLLEENQELIEERVEQLAACRALMDDYPIRTLKEFISPEQLVELKTVKMNLTRSKYDLGKGWNTLLTTDTDFLRLKPGVAPDEVTDRSKRYRSLFRSPDVGTYSDVFNEKVDHLAEMAYGDNSYVWPREVEKILEFVIPVRYLIIVRTGEVTPPLLNGKTYLAGYLSGEAFCFDLADKRLIAAFLFETTNSGKVEYTYAKNAGVVGEANSAGHSLQEDLLDNTWPAFWNKFHQLASSAISSNNNLKLPFKQVAMDEARLNVLRKRIDDVNREHRVKQGMDELKGKTEGISRSKLPELIEKDK